MIYKFKIARRVYDGLCRDHAIWMADNFRHFDQRWSVGGVTAETRSKSLAEELRARIH